MKKAIIVSLMLILGVAPFVFADDSNSGLDKDTIYYPNASISSAKIKYNRGNYTGCLQELFSLVKKNPKNALAYYYIGMAYTHLDMKNEAIEAYEKVMELRPNTYMAQYAEIGRDCLNGGPKCQAEGNSEELDDLDKFIKAPYGNGLSPELNKEIRDKQLNNIKDTINRKEELEHQDIKKIKDFDNNKSLNDDNIRIAQVSDEEVLQAVKTLKDAGLNVNIQTNQYQDPQMAEMSMLLGTNNYNNNNNMMNMLPMLMNKSQNGENIDPRLMQAMLMNSMMTDFSFNDNNNRY